MTSKKASRPRPRPSPVSRNWATSSSSTTTTRSPSSTTPPSLSAKTSESDTRRTAGTFQHVEGGENVSGILDAVAAAKAVVDRPSIILLRTIIGFPAPKKMNTGDVHGSALGADEVAAVKEALGFDPAKSFDVDADALAHAREVVSRGADARKAWQVEFDAWAARETERKELFDRPVRR